MVVQKINDTPLEAPVIHSIDMASEHTKSKENDIKSRKRHKLKRTISQNVPEDCLISNSNVISTEISQEDLEELRSVYKKCKAVIKKIETKYGHLFDEKNNLELENNSNNGCNCKFNKKTVFDDEGQYTTQEIVPDIHICPKKQRYPTSKIIVKEPEVKENVQIEDDDDSLPSDLKELSEILKDDNINIVYRNKVIEKIKAIRLDDLNTMRFDKKFLVERLKLKPNEFMEFKGANVNSLPGYPIKPS